MVFYGFRTCYDKDKEIIVINALNSARAANILDAPGGDEVTALINDYIAVYQSDDESCTQGSDTDWSICRSVEVQCKGHVTFLFSIEISTFHAP